MQGETPNYTAPRWIALIVLAGILSLLLFPNLHPLEGHWAKAGWNLLHVPGFFLVTLCLFFIQSKKGELLRVVFYAAMGAVFIAAGTEVVQGFVGRSGSVEDLLLDMAGIGLASVAISRRGRWKRQRVGWYSLLVLTVVIVSLRPAWSLELAIWSHRARLPDIGSFLQPGSLQLWKAQGNASVSIDEKGGGLTVSIGPGEFGGVSYRPGMQDWSAYSELELAIQNPGGAFRLGIRVDDLYSSGNGVWHSSEWEVVPGRSLLHILLETEDAPNSPAIDRAKLVRLALFTGKETSLREFVINSAFLR